jgi:hypothetical protein
MNKHRIAAIVIFILVMAFPFRWAFFLESSKFNIPSLISFLLVLVGFALTGFFFHLASQSKSH